MRFTSLLVFAAACAGSPNAVEVELQPSVVSSLDGTTQISAIVAADTTPLDGVTVHATITYVDRNGTTHDVMPIDGRTDARGVFHATLTGLQWDGTGTVTVATNSMVSGEATFAVLDRTPPKIQILPPTADLRVGPGLPLDVQVKVTDEIGVSEVTLTGSGGISGTRTTTIASGSQDSTVTFRLAVSPTAAPGPTIQLNALAGDLSGNLATSNAMALTVDPAITIATPPGLTGSLLVDGTATQIADPRAIAVSSKDGKLYVADNPAAGGIIWQVDATTGAIATTPVVVGVGELEGVAFDATADNLYYSDRQNRVGRLTWNGSAYASPVLCDNVTQQDPQDPYHLVVDPTLGALVVDGNQKQVVRLATCATTTVGTAMTMNANFDTPRGIAAGGSGEYYVSDIGRDRISRLDATTGAVTAFSNAVNQPYGMEWVPGTSAWANSLMVAAFGDRVVEGVTATGVLAAAFVRSSPIDVTFAGGAMYVVTAPVGTLHGRIYKVTGF